MGLSSAVGAHSAVVPFVFADFPVWIGADSVTSRLLTFSFYSPTVMGMRTLAFPKSCVVCCKKCGHDVLAGTEGFPASSIFVVCSLCGEKRRYSPSEVIHGRPHFVVRRKRPRELARRGPVAAQLGGLRGEIVVARAR
jgi:hypothetical protein